MQNQNTENKTYSLSVEKRIAKPRADVFRAISEGRLFLNCSGGSETLKVDFKVGGKYHVDFMGADISNNGEFLEIIPHEKIVFTWCENPSQSMTPNTKVSITLKEEGNATLVHLTHEGFTTEAHKANHLGGWTGGLQDMAEEITNGKLRFNRYFPAPVDKLFEACKNPASFFGAMGDISKGSFDFKVGGKFKMPTPDGEVSGEYLEIIPNEKIVFTWQSTGCPVAASSKVSLSFEKDDDNDGWIELIHEGVDTEKSQKSHRKGWDWILARLLK